SGLTVVTSRSQLHDGYLNLLLAGGLFALGLVLLLLWKSIAAAWSLASGTADNGVRFLYMACLGVIVAFAVTSTTGGVVNDAFYTAAVGIFAGFALSAGETLNTAARTTKLYSGVRMGVVHA